MDEWIETQECTIKLKDIKYVYKEDIRGLIDKYNLRAVLHNGDDILIYSDHYEYMVDIYKRAVSKHLRELQNTCEETNDSEG